MKARTRPNPTDGDCEGAMDRRSFLKGTAGLVGGGIAANSLGCGRRPVDVRETGRMNLLMVVIEDCSPQTLGCYGAPLVKTPHLDAFARTAVRFDRAYCQATVCNSSRASFLTGLRPAATNVYYNLDPVQRMLPPYAKTLPQLVRAKPVFSANVGKLFHSAATAGPYLDAFDRLELCDLPVGYAGIASQRLGPSSRPRVPRFPDDDSLERELVEIEEAWSAERGSFEKGSREWARAKNRLRQLRSEWVGDSGRSEHEELDSRRSRLVAELLDGFAQDQSQFFLSVGLDRPHVPLVCPKEYVSLYDPAEMPAPNAPVERDVDIPQVAKRWGRNYDIFNYLEPTPARVQKAVASYYACVSFMDAQIGVILDGLEQAGLSESTIVVVLSDHGFQLGEHGCWSKSTLFEQSTRVPLLVRIPGASGNGEICDELVELVDLVPTIAELWGLEPAGRGRSLTPLLSDPSRPGKQMASTVCTLERVLGRSLRTKRYRYSEWRGHRHDASVVSEAELYDLDADPWEHVNLARDPRFDGIRSGFARILESTGGWPPRFVG